MPNIIELPSRSSVIFQLWRLFLRGVTARKQNIAGISDIHQPATFADIAPIERTSSAYACQYFVQ